MADPEFEETSVLIVGAGPAGIGAASLLKQCGVPCVIIERGRIGESLLSWPEETRFISPSFTGNFFGSVDLNALTPDSSPAFGLQAEHPTGAEYARYLNDVCKHHELDVRTGVSVTSIVGAKDYVPPVEDPKIEEIVEDPVLIAKMEAEEAARVAAAKAKVPDPIPMITVKTSSGGDFLAEFVIWAGGEYQFPKTIPHTVRPGKNYKQMPVGKHVIIGGSESGMDAAYHLVKYGSEVTVLDENSTWTQRVSDSSYGLSPHTLGRVREMQASGKATFIAERASSITADEVRTKSHTIVLTNPAIDATGFDMKQSVAGSLFEFGDGHCGVTATLTSEDESTRFRNIFLTGPNIVHGKAVFCFIYKYRQRWAVIAQEILKRLGKQHKAIEYYAEKGFMLKDLSCCGDSCAC